MFRATAGRSRLAASLLSGALALSACTGGAETSRSEPTTADNTTDPAPPPKHSPLTGQKVDRLPDRRAVVVKIENTSSSEPQVGLGSADLVVEELVEGGLTRLAAFYYSSLPSRVGPVRSLRGTDIGIVKPARAVLVASGGNPGVMKRVRRAQVVTATEGTPGYFRVDDRVAPYNLFVNPRRLPDAKLDGPKPQPYLPWGRAGALGRGKPAKHVTARFSAGSATEWTWNGRVWRRQGSYAAQGDEFRPDNVLALQVRLEDAGYRDAAGNPVPESVLTGKGPATLFHRGRAYQGAWTKRSAKSPLRLVTPKGDKLPVPPGRTWVELVPRSDGAVRFGGR